MNANSASAYGAPAPILDMIEYWAFIEKRTPGNILYLVHEQARLYPSRYSPTELFKPEMVTFIIGAMWGSQRR